MRLAGMEVTYAVLHSSLFVPNGVGTVGPTCSASGDATHKPLKMCISEDAGFLIIDTGKHTITVPMTNVTHMLVKK